MIWTLIAPILQHYGIHILVGLLALFGAKKLKDAVLGDSRPDPRAALDGMAQVLSKNHQVAAGAESAKTEGEADAALDALADADRK